MIIVEGRKGNAGAFFSSLLELLPDIGILPNSEVKVFRPIRAFFFEGKW